jgi:hypothetical protein
MFYPKNMIQYHEETKKAYHQPSPKEMEMCQFHRGRIKKAIEILNTRKREFDDLSLLQTYYSNRDAVNSYLVPKRNDTEVRVVGGATEKRIESIVNELISYNYQHELRFVDKDDLEIRDFGKIMEDTITRTNQQEDDDDVRTELAWELCSQPIVFVEELYETVDFGTHKEQIFRKRLRTALECFGGDPSLSAYKWNEQPFICVYDRMTLQRFKSLYSDSPNAQYVRGGQNTELDVYGYETTFRLGFLAENEVEIVKYMSLVDDEIQIYANGVPLLPVGAKFSEHVWMFKKYPVRCAIAKPTSRHFLYGRGYAQMMKFLQALSDETTRNIIRKFRQAIEPPRAVKNRETIYSRDIFEAGAITYGVDAEAIKKLVEHDGVTQGEMNVWQAVKTEIEEMSSRSATNLGVQAGKKQTATAVMQQQQEAVKMLGQIIIGYTRLTRECTDMRTCNILEQSTKPMTSIFVDNGVAKVKEAYRSFTLNNASFNSKTGDHVIQFADRDVTEEEQNSIKEYEDEQEEYGKPVKISVINAKKLRSIPMRWYINIRSKPKETEDLDKLLYQDKLSQATQIAQVTGMQLNGDKVSGEFEETWRVKDWFNKISTPTVPMEAPQGIGQELKAGIQAGVKTPAKQEPSGKTALGVK